MTTKPSGHCTVELQAQPSRIGQIRRIVSAQLRYWHLDALIHPAALGVTELLSNVHRHAQPDKRCTVDILLTGEGITVSVGDSGPRLPRVGAAGAAGGRGLAVIASVSDSWGVREQDGGGKAVWFTLRAAGHRAAADPLRSPSGHGHPAPRGAAVHAAAAPGEPAPAGHLAAGPAGGDPHAVRAGARASAQHSARAAARPAVSG